ncbi:hypothetical protein [Vulcanococcus sp.]
MALPTVTHHHCGIRSTVGTHQLQKTGAYTDRPLLPSVTASLLEQVKGEL